MTYMLFNWPGISGIAIIRVSGDRYQKSNKLLTRQRDSKAKSCNIKKNELIDEGIILWFPGPESYTGEDMVEFHLHGSKAVIDALHHSISKVENCRLAEAGEFTKLAFQNGKINLLKQKVLQI